VVCFVLRLQLVLPKWPWSHYGLYSKVNFVYHIILFYTGLYSRGFFKVNPETGSKVARASKGKKNVSGVHPKVSTFWKRLGNLSADV
jgi:hypothetical protein